MLKSAYHQSNNLQVFLYVSIFITLWVCGGMDISKNSGSATAAISGLNPSTSTNDDFNFDPLCHRNAGIFDKI